MDSTEMEGIVKEAGWILIRRTRRNGRKYIYVSRRNGAKMIERYIGSVSKVQEMSKEQFKALLEEKIATPR